MFYRMQNGRVIYGVSGRRDYALNALSEVALFRIGDDLDGLVAQALVQGDGLISRDDLIDLPLVDYELIMAHFYAATFGEVIGQNIHCSECQNKYAYEFSLGTFTTLLKKEVTRDEDRVFGGASYSFPTLSVIRQAQYDKDAIVRSLWHGPDALEGAELRAFEAHLSKTCPVMHEDLHAPCPNCHADQRRRFVLRTHIAGQLRTTLRSLLGQIHLLAACYHWPAAEILALPRRSREVLVNAIRGSARPTQRLQAR